MDPLRYQEASRCGSIEAWGAAFNYRYDSDGNTLRVFRNENGCKTLNITLPAKITADPLLFIRQLEKATQIKALMLSNNTTIKLCQTIVPDKLSAIAKSVSKLALNSFDLSTNRIEKFSKLVRRSYGLNEFEIAYIDHLTSGSYYKAKIVSSRDNCVIVRQDDLATTLQDLSEGIIRDLIALEFSSRHNGTSEQLLRLSTRLSVMSKIVNEKFLPEKYLMSPPDSASFSTSDIT
ncbi:MAG: hypothetical protein CMH27_10070 [Micavibrio sp.]|nr:hypothetical protein [Micavibrio sp.]|tara:strand:- start:1603 stop:2304 length:702 start_codon:yes stop_codon:yes gene_type:complete